MIHSTVNHQRGKWVGLKKSKTWWRNTWMVPKKSVACKHWRLHNIMGPKLFEIAMESFLNLRFPELFFKLNFEEVSYDIILIVLLNGTNHLRKKIHLKKPSQYICKWINLGMYYIRILRSFQITDARKRICYTYNKRYLLYHIKNSAVLVQPHIMVRYGHCLKSNFLGIFEKRIWPPNKVEPFYW